MKNIKVQISTESVRSCNSCGARNFEPSIKIEDGRKKVDTLYELRISNMCVALCKECLAEVAISCAAALKEQESE